MQHGIEPRRRSRLPLLLAVVMAVVVVGGIWLGLSRPAEDLTDCIQVPMVASVDKSEVLAELSQEYNDADRALDGTCIAWSVQGQASGTTLDALVDGWNPAIDGGPAPVVWSPAASSWAVLLEQEYLAKDTPSPVPDGPYESIVQAPLVVAMPRPMAEALGWPQQPIGWNDLRALAADPAGWASKGHPEWGAFKLGKTNPDVSTSGLHATVASYFAATGLSSDLRVSDVENPAVRAQVAQLEQAVVHYGDTTLTFLTNLLAADARGQGLGYVSAVTVEEKSVVNYNEGNPTGDPALADAATPPKIPLVSVYPAEGTMISDNPFIPLHADWVSDQQRQAAADVIDWLHADGPQERLAEFGFRSYSGEVIGGFGTADGILPDAPAAVISPPSPEVFAAIKSSWDELRKKARVLLVLDVSGSMGEPVEGSGQTRLELAKDAVLASLDEFAPHDEVGLWAFSTPVDGSVPYRDLIPIDAISSNADDVRRVVGGLQPDGGTALYATLRAAQEYMLGRAAADRITAIVLLSDGRNEYPADTGLDSLLDQLDVEPGSPNVRVFTIGYGGDADVDTLRAIATASEGAYYDASDPRTIDQVLVSVISNF